MTKIPFFRKNFLQTGSIKVAAKYRRSRTLNFLDRVIRPIICMLKKTNSSNWATMYAVSITKPSFSVIHQLKLAVDNTEVNLIRSGFYLINPPLILCVKV